MSTFCEHDLQAAYAYSSRFPCALTAQDGRPIKIVERGRLNLDNGPDILDALIDIDGIRCRGDIEIHLRWEDWFRHGHHEDRRYRQVILHLVWHPLDGISDKLARRMPQVCRDRLLQDAPQDFSHALATAAIRELWEETGLILGQKGPWDIPPPADWADFAALGYLPDAHPLQFVFRAITPKGRPRRFDARFFLVDADEIANDLDDFSAAQDELSHLQWIPLEEVRGFDLPFITEVVLAEVAARAQDLTPPDNVPFFNNAKEESLFQRLKGRGPMSGKVIDHGET